MYNARQILPVKLWICLSSIWFASSSGQWIGNAKTKIGRIFGYLNYAEVVDFNGTYVVGKYVQYLGVPYAEPPLGELRFAKPKPKAPLTEPHNGSFYRPACHQGYDATSSANHALLKSTEFSEDCLTLDIYRPFSDTNTTTYPVVIVIHGGSYISGGSKGYVADVFSVYGNVITVVINYRLGVLGFFSLGDSVVPGNYGLWDQHLAIKWTVDNIAYFGGDVNKITILGHSSGSSSAILQALYPENKGLFHRVIAQSGSPIPALRFSSFMGSPTGNSVAEAMDCKEGSSNEILECMRAKTLEEIDAGLNRASSAISLAPVIDHDFIQYNPEEALMGDGNSTKEIRDVFSSLGLLTGINNMDGITHLSYIWATMLNQNVSDLEIDSATFEDTIIPAMLKIFLYDPSDNASEVVTSLLSFQYSDLRDPENSDKIRESLLSMSSDVDFSIPAIKTANLHSALDSQSGTYFYEFSAGLNLTTSSTPSWLEGAGHGEEVFYLLGFSKKTLEAWSHMDSYFPGTEKEIQTSRRLIKAWSNFIKSGNPNSPDPLSSAKPWPQYDPVTKPYMEISSSEDSVSARFGEPRTSFWLNLLPSVIDVAEKASENRSGTVTINNKSPMFDISIVTEDNILLALIVISGCLLIAYMLLCCYNVARIYAEKHYAPQKDIKHLK